MGRFEAAGEAEARHKALEAKVRDMAEEMGRMRQAMRMMAPSGSPFAAFL
jgi:hypothetical protein